VQSRGWNLVETTSGGWLDVDGPDNIATGNITGQDPRLGPLQDNGGPTWTHALLDGANPSPAINAGSFTDIDGLTISSDQRGFSRPWPPMFGYNDIGAYERGVANLAITKTVIPDEALPGQAVTYTLAFTNTGYEIAADVLITDRVPISVTVTGVVSTGVAITDTGASPPYVWAVQDVIPGHGGTIVLSGVLATGLPAGHTFGNTAIIGTSSQENVTDNNQAMAELSVLNAAPVAVNDGYQTTTDNPLTVAAPGVLANDTDANGDTLTAVRDTEPLTGTLTLNADGSFVYTPAPGIEGVVTFTYHASDGTADSNVATVTITVRPHRVYLPLVLRN
jgi:uncharacterized repeat protein (TIGR01451 family)